MMSDIAGVLLAAVETTREVIAFINAVKDAPETVIRVRDQLNDVNGALQSLDQQLGEDFMPEALRSIAQETKLESAIRSLQKTCETFRQYMSKWIKHSTPDHASLRDGFNIARHKDKIALLSLQLESCKQTVTLALGVCSFRGQLQHIQLTEDICGQLAKQEADSMAMMTELQSSILDLSVKEDELDVIRRGIKDDDDELDLVMQEQRDVTRARVSLAQYQDVCKFIARMSKAERTEQNIGDVKLGDLNNVAVGMSNIGNILGIKQKIGRVEAGSKNRLMIGIHNNVDHNASLHKERPR